MWNSRNFSKRMAFLVPQSLREYASVGKKDHGKNDRIYYRPNDRCDQKRTKPFLARMVFTKRYHHHQRPILAHYQDSKVMPAGGFEPPRHRAADFKSAASTVPPDGPCWIYTACPPRPIWPEAASAAVLRISIPPRPLDPRPVEHPRRHQRTQDRFVGAGYVGICPTAEVVSRSARPPPCAAHRTSGRDAQASCAD